MANTRSRTIVPQTLSFVKTRKHKMHTIDYQNGLNPAQYKAATTLDGSILVVAGAGSGKTRTIVYRLVRLVESGIPASSILLLTFTKKAAQEMLARARLLLAERGMPSLSEHSSSDIGLASVQGGTFHSYAYSVLRLFQPSGYAKNLTIMDQHDIISALQHCREELKAGKGDRSFPKNQTIQGLLSKSRNKEMSLNDVVRQDSYHLLPHVETMASMGKAYAEFKKSKSLLDYDDLLFELERVLLERPEALAYCQRKHRYIMVDEYQDTNPVQARIACLIAGAIPLTQEQEEAGLGKIQSNIMVVGDDAQSIYAFRGADVRNILRFPELFAETTCIQLEENYRSTQPILDFSNGVLAKATEGFKKNLFTSRSGGVLPKVVRPISDRSQATLIGERIAELLQKYPAREIAVLFRSGFHSYGLEMQLNKMGIRFRKYGGIRYAEAAHIKDVLSYLRLLVNPLDFSAFSRMAELSKGIGAKTCLKIYQLMLAGDRPALVKTTAKFPDLQADLALIDRLRNDEGSPASLLTSILDHYQPRLETLYPDDYPKRRQGLEQMVQIAGAYSSADLFIAHHSLDDRMEEQEQEDCVTLSTIHSAKGLEWSAVFILDLVEERFPSKHSLIRPDDFEEERRLMYVACTRAKEILELYVPATLYDRGSGGNIPTIPSPFIRELPHHLYTEYQESYTGAVVHKPNNTGQSLSRRGIGSQAQNSTQVYGSTQASAAQTASTYTSTLGTNQAFSSTPPMGNAYPRPLPAQGSPNLDEIGHALGAGQSSAPKLAPEQCGFCHHRVFGRGKIVQHLPPDKYRVNFPGIGLKVIMSAYLTMES